MGIQIRRTLLIWTMGFSLGAWDYLVSSPVSGGEVTLLELIDLLIGS
jgi:hypothetical protein